MTRVGIVGAGMIGAAVMRLSVAAGHRVMIANSRGPETLQPLVHAMNGAAVAATVADIESDADLIVFAAPLKSYSEFPPQSFAGRIVIDASNYYPERFGHLTDLDQADGLSSVFLQAQWPQATLVKALNTMDYLRLEALAARPDGMITAVPVAGDSATAVEKVSKYVESIGFAPLIAGGLADSWRFQPGTPIHVQPYLRMPVEYTDPADRFTRAAALPVDIRSTRALLDAAG